MENLLGTCAVLVTIAALAVAANVLWPRIARHWLRGDQLSPDDDEEDRIASLESQMRLLQGRLNRVAPPRKGTGLPSSEEEIVAPEPTSTSGYRTPVSRAAVLAEFRRRRGL